MTGAARAGLVAVGDSITTGDGQAMLGLPCRPWTLWLAAALDLPYTSLAVSGHTTADALTLQLPRLRAQGAFALACLYLGVNDARAVDFDVTRFAVDYGALARAAAQHADRLLVVTIPLDLGRPPAGESVIEANTAIRRVAGELGAVTVSLEDLRGWRHVLPDAVHLTALGQLELAERAWRALPGSGVSPLVEAGAQRIRARALARYAATGYVPALGRDLARRAREGVLI